MKHQRITDCSARRRLYLDDVQIAELARYAREVSLLTHQNYGNFIADSLEQLHNIIEEDDPESQILAAESLRDAAQAMINRLEAGEAV